MDFVITIDCVLVPDAQSPKVPDDEAAVDTATGVGVVEGGSAPPDDDDEPLLFPPPHAVGKNKQASPVQTTYERIKRVKQCLLSLR
jgi:hypothetical protein